MRNFTSPLQLRLILCAFFLALAVPSAILVRQAYSQLKWESFALYRSQAEELSARINNQLNQAIAVEESHSLGDFSFLVASGTAQRNYLQPSALSGYPVASVVPGLIGYFQLDGAGHFSTPLLPQQQSQAFEYGVSPEQLSARRQLQQEILDILSDNQLVQPVRERFSDKTDESQKKSALTLEEKIVTAVKREAASGAAAPAAKVERELALADPETTEQRGYAADFERLKDGEYAEKQQQKLDSLSNFGRVSDLNLQYGYEEEQQALVTSQAESAPRSVRKEKSVMPQAQFQTPLAASDRDDVAFAATAEPDITIFESEIDPFDFALLDSGHFVLYRTVWRNGERLVQGAILAQQEFLQGAIEPLFRATALSQMSDLAVAYQGNIFSAFGGVSGSGYLSQGRFDNGGSASDDASAGELLYQTRLSGPFGDLELIYSITRLPASQGATIIGWTALILAVVLLGGLFLMYRLGLRQIALAQQQRDFVSSVSHELKTPLTSIRMYSEMLREGWVDDEKRRSYYDFIFEESERLSRLIANVLQLARMNGGEMQPDLKSVSVDTLFDMIQSKLSSQVESAGFRMTMTIEPSVKSAMVAVDTDSFAQILINLVDNAIKFSASASQHAIEIAAHLRDTNEVVISVRDFGPGIPSNQMKKIFQLFYRSENELTRETVGTGIGLALVHQQVLAMGGKVDVFNREPGAEFCITLNRVK